MIYENAHQPGNFYSFSKTKS